MVDLENAVNVYEHTQKRFFFWVSFGIGMAGTGWALAATLWMSDRLHLSRGMTAIVTGGAVSACLLCGFILCLSLLKRMNKSRQLFHALDRDRAKYRETMDTIYDGYYEVDLTGQLMVFNQSLSDIFDVSPSQLSGSNIYDYFQGEMGEKVREGLRVVARTSLPVKGFTWQHVLSDGNVRLLEASATLVRDEQGMPIGFRGIVRNTTARIRDKEAIAERENQLRSLLNAIPECVILKDGAGRWLVANDHTFRVFDIASLDYRGKRGVDIAKHSKTYEQLLTQCAKSDEQTWRTGRPLHMEQTVIDSDGETRLFEILKLPEFCPDGRRNQLLVVARDVTERRRTEELMMRSEKLSLVGQLAAGVAHEIRNPLTSIRGFVQLLEATSNGNPDYFRIILAELLRIESIINEFLLLAKPEALRTRLANVAEIVEQTMQLLGPQALLHNVHIALNVDNHLPLIECEPNHLKQVFINLLKNAIESMNDGGGVHIRLKMEDDFVLIQFIDQGRGIPKDVLDRLGEPFYTTKEKGTGVGLMVTQRIIETHRGTLTIHSTQGQGTCAEVRLPVQLP